MKNMYKRPHYFSFSGQMTAPEFWSSLGTGLIGAFCVLMVLCMLLCTVVPAELAQLSQTMNWMTLAVCLVWLVRVAAISRRRLRDAGFTAKSYLWLLIPVVGLVIFAVTRLCARSAE